MPFVDAGIDWCGKLWADLDNGERIWINTYKSTVLNPKISVVSCKDGVITVITTGGYTHTISEDILNQGRNMFFKEWCKARQLCTIHCAKLLIFYPIKKHAIAIAIPDGCACYVIEDSICVSLGTDLYKVDSLTGKRMSDKLEPTFTHPIKISSNTHIAAVRRCEINSIGILEIQTDEQIICEQVNEGEKFCREDNDYIFASGEHYLCVIPCNPIYVQFYTKSNNTIANLFNPTILRTFYGIYQNANPKKNRGIEYFIVCNVTVRFMWAGHVEIDWTPINKTGTVTKGAAAITE